MEIVPLPLLKIPLEKVVEFSPSRRHFLFFFFFFLIFEEGSNS